MSNTANNLLAEILRLPAADRANIVQEILLTFSPATETYGEDQIEEELDTRLEEFKRSPKGVPWAELRDEA